MSQHSSVAGASRPVKEAGFFTKIKNVACLKSSSSSDKGKGGKGKSKSSSNKVSHGFHLVEGQSGHKMEDYHVAEYRKRKNHTLGLFAIFDGHLGDRVPTYLKDNLFNNILEEVSFPSHHYPCVPISNCFLYYTWLKYHIQPNFWKDPEAAIRSAYSSTDKFILDNSMQLGPGGSTAVTAIVIDGKDLWVANIGDSRAVVCERGSANQITVDHEPHAERRRIEKQGGFVTTLPGDVPRVNGQLAVARAFGDQSLKAHLSSEPDVRHVPIDSTIDFVILASDGLWKNAAVAFHLSNWLCNWHNKNKTQKENENGALAAAAALAASVEVHGSYWFLLLAMERNNGVVLVVLPNKITFGLITMMNDGCVNTENVNHSLGRSTRVVVMLAAMSVMVVDMQNQKFVIRGRVILGTVMKNEEAVNLVKSVKDPQAAAKLLTTEALARKSKDDISCIVIRFG
ncbi:putative protein phosphatase 2C 44 isoform X1 [Gossypium australe]|uniref:PPM-type phosphatase domain-containing protein n=1 Tax=Gossypium australe TaxID=47621 RepID=A0A5B6VNX2_9ROSI|nr:putative protein phosphatase 2C 44 isoform X1 [Gossypium australe]